MKYFFHSSVFVSPVEYNIIWPFLQTRQIIFVLWLPLFWIKVWPIYEDTEPETHYLHLEKKYILNNELFHMPCSGKNNMICMSLIEPQHRYTL